MGRLFTAGSAVFLAIGGFLFGYDSGIISSTIVQPYFVAYMGTPTNSQVGGIVSTFPAGAILGALSIAYLADVFGRKMTVFIGSVISVFGCALQGGAVNLSMLMAGHFFAGVAVGLLSAIVPMYCSEIATSEDRGKLSGLLQFMLSWGFFIAQWLGFGCFKVNSDFQWRFPLSFQVVPGLIMACGIWFLQESPRWLVEKDRYDEARLSLKKLHGTGHNEEFLDLEYREIRDTIVAEKSVAVKSWKKILTKASWRRRLFLGCGIQAFGQLSGINVINYYGPRIYKLLGIDTHTSLEIVGISGSLSIIWCALGLLLLDKIGRVKPMIIATTGWLVTTARSCGLKGFAIIRTRSKDAGRRKILPISQFPVLAKHIAKFQPPIAVPTCLWLATKRAIKARQQSYDYYTSPKTASDRDEADESHLYFITVLQDVLQAFQPCFQTPAPIDPVHRPSVLGTMNALAPTPSLPSVTTRFEKASVESDGEGDPTPSQEATVGPISSLHMSTPAIEGSSNQSCQAEQAGHEFEAETVSTEIEMMIAARSLLQDMIDMRKVIRDLWEQYMASNIDLITVTCTTTIAGDFVRRLERDFDQQFPDRPTPKQLLEALYKQQCTEKMIDPAARARQGDPLNFEAYNHAQSAMITPITFLEKLEVSPEFPMPERDNVQKLDPSMLRCPPTGRSHWRTDVELLTRFCTTAFYMACGPREFIVEDWLIQQLGKLMRKQKKASLGLAFAAQCYLDAQYTLGDDVIEPASQLRHLGSVIRQSALDTRRLHEKQKTEVRNASEDDKDIFSTIMNLVDEWVLRDIVQEWVYEKYPTVGRLPRPFYVFVYHPALCGLLAFQLCQTVQITAIAHGRQRLTTEFSTHLYNAIRQEEVCAEPWPALQQLTGFYNERDIFCGPRPQRPYDYQLQLMRSAGAKASTAARCNTGKSTIFKPNIELPGRLPLSDKLLDRYRCRDEESICASVASLEYYLNKHHAKESHSPRDVERLTPVELLNTFVTSLESEIPSLKFDLLLLHRQSYLCLQRLHSRFSGTLQRVKAFSEYHTGSGRSNYHLIVIDIFAIANAEYQPGLGQVPFMVHPEPKLQEKILGMAGGIVEQFLREENANDQAHTY